MKLLFFGERISEIFCIIKNLKLFFDRRSGFSFVVHKKMTAAADNITNNSSMEENIDDNNKTDTADLQMDGSKPQKTETQFDCVFKHDFLETFDGDAGRYPLRNRKNNKNSLPMEEEKPAEPMENIIDEDEKLISSSLPYAIDEIMDAEQYQHDDVLVKGIKPEEFTLEYVKRTGLAAPLFFDDPPEALGMKMPNPDEFTVDDVIDCVGKDRKIEVVDVYTQKSRRMKLHEFVDYYKKPVEERTELLNVLSLEFTSTKLADIVSPPELVTKIDWIDNVWPKELFARQQDLLAKSAWAAKRDFSTYPKVQRYCLMSVANCFTDYHIDFGGTSVWYHILKGEKVFWLIEPTEENLRRYEKWMNKRDGRFFGDCVSKCARVHLKAGNTLIIPSGWIHCVYTPCDSLVFGGNFLHSYSVPMQLRVSRSEQRIKIGNSRIFPHFKQITWCHIAELIKAATGRIYQRRPPPQAFNTEKKKKTRNGRKSSKVHGIDGIDNDDVHQHSLEEDAGRMEQGEESEADKIEQRNDGEEAEDEACCYYDKIGNAEDGSFTFNPIQLAFGNQSVEGFKRVEHYNREYLESLSPSEVNGFPSLIRFAKRLLASKQPEVVEGITRPLHLVRELEELLKEICHLFPNNNYQKLLNESEIEGNKKKRIRNRRRMANNKNKGKRVARGRPRRIDRGNAGAAALDDIAPLSGAPMIKKTSRNGVEYEFRLLKTVHSVEELNVFRLQHFCHFSHARKSPNFTCIILNCMNRNVKRGMCPFSLMAQRTATEGSSNNEIQVYTSHFRHNHPIATRRGNKPTNKRKENSQENDDDEEAGGANILDEEEEKEGSDQVENAIENRGQEKIETDEQDASGPRSTSGGGDKKEEKKEWRIKKKKTQNRRRRLPTKSRATLMNIVGPPPPAIVKKLSKNGVEHEYSFLKTVHSLEELDAFRLQNSCRFWNLKRLRQFTSVILCCMRRTVKMGMCPFSLLAQQTTAKGSNSNQVHVYATGKHNHPMKRGKVAPPPDVNPSPAVLEAGANNLDEMEVEEESGGGLLLDQMKEVVNRDDNDEDEEDSVVQEMEEDDESREEETAEDDAAGPSSTSSSSGDGVVVLQQALNIVGPPPPAVVKKTSRNGVEHDYSFLKTFHSLEELDAFSLQNSCNFSQAKQRQFTSVILYCMRRNVKMGMCPFSLLLQRTATKKGSNQVHVYANGKHNHRPLKRKKVARLSKKLSPPADVNTAEANMGEEEENGAVLVDQMEIAAVTRGNNDEDEEESVVQETEEDDESREDEEETTEDDAGAPSSSTSSSSGDGVVVLQQALNIVGLPPPAVVKKTSRNGVERVYRFLKTVHSMVELDAFRYENFCQFGRAKKNPNFTSIILLCQYIGKAKGMCPYSLMAQRNETKEEGSNDSKSDSIHVYVHSKHNHPVVNAKDGPTNGTKKNMKRRRRKKKTHWDEDTDEEEEVVVKKYSRKEREKPKEEERRIVHVIID